MISENDETLKIAEYLRQGEKIDPKGKQINESGKIGGKLSEDFFP